MLLRQADALVEARQRLADGVLRLAFGDAFDFLAPPGKLGRGDGNVVAFVNHVIDFAAKGIERHDGATALQRQEEKAVIERGAALGALFLAILVGIHGLHSNGTPGENQPIPFAELRSTGKYVATHAADSFKNA